MADVIINHHHFDLSSEKLKNAPVKVDYSGRRIILIDTDNNPHELKYNEVLDSVLKTTNIETAKKEALLNQLIPLKDAGYEKKLKGFKKLSVKARRHWGKSRQYKLLSKAQTWIASNKVNSIISNKNVVTVTSSESDTPIDKEKIIIAEIKDQIDSIYKDIPDRRNHALMAIKKLETTGEILTPDEFNVLKDIIPIVAKRKKLKSFGLSEISALSSPMHLAIPQSRTLYDQYLDIGIHAVGKTIPFPDENIPDLIKKQFIECLKQPLMHPKKAILTRENVIPLYNLANHFNIPWLITECKSFIGAHIDQMDNQKIYLECLKGISFPLPEDVNLLEPHQYLFKTATDYMVKKSSSDPAYFNKIIKIVEKDPQKHTYLFNQLIVCASKDPTQLNLRSSLSNLLFNENFISKISQTEQIEKLLISDLQNLNTAEKLSGVLNYVNPEKSPVLYKAILRRLGNVYEEKPELRTMAHAVALERGLFDLMLVTYAETSKSFPRFIFEPEKSNHIYFAVTKELEGSDWNGFVKKLGQFKAKFPESKLQFPCMMSSFDFNKEESTQLFNSGLISSFICMHLRPKGVQDLANALTLPNCTIKHIELGTFQYDPAELMDLSPILQHVGKLESFVCNGINVKFLPENVKTLADQIKTSKNLKFLDIRRCDELEALEEKDYMALIDAIAANQSLQRIRIPPHDSFSSRQLREKFDDRENFTTR